jgi:hypothetical protein
MVCPHFSLWGVTLLWIIGPSPAENEFSKKICFVASPEFISKWPCRAETCIQRKRLPYPAPREPSAMSPRRLPGASKGKCGSHRPRARFIEDNSVLCGHRLRRCHADCFPPSPAARGRPPRGSQRAILQASCHASRPRRRFKNWRINS